MGPMILQTANPMVTESVQTISTPVLVLILILVLTRSMIRKKPLRSTPMRPSMLRHRLLLLRGGDAPPEQIGPYRVLEPLGEGGFGIVYRAEQRGKVRRTVALKIIKKGMDSNEVLARFDAEKNALSLMNHPNIARVIDSGQTDSGQPYFVMEYVDGTPITTYCQKERLTLKERLQLFQQVCRGVQHAHSKAVVHRDLKPANILVTRPR